MWFCLFFGLLSPFPYYLRVVCCLNVVSPFFWPPSFLLFRTISWRLNFCSWRRQAPVKKYLNKPLNPNSIIQSIALYPIAAIALHSAAIDIDIILYNTALCSEYLSQLRHSPAAKS